MVGILGLGGKSLSSVEARRSDSSRPPPAHIGRDSPSYVPFPDSASPTRDIPPTSTQPNSHFFSLPLWRKRVLPAAFPVRRISEGPRTLDPELTSHTLLSNPVLQKDLPPTPSNSAPSLSNGHSIAKLDKRVGNTLDDQVISGPPIPCSPYPRVTSHQSSKVDLSLPSPPRSTTVLAHTALQVGVPPVIPRASVSSVQEVHTAQVAPLTPFSQSRDSKPDLRHSKSCHSIRSADIRDTPYMSEFGQITGTRGVSFASDANTQNAPHTNSRSLFRRPSFWSGKKVESSPGSVKHRLVPPDLSALPMVRTTSPMDIEFPSSASLQNQGMRTPSSLSRRHSEKGRKPVLSSSNGPVPELPIANASARPPPRHRPATADPSSPHSPRTNKRPSTAGAGSSLRAPSSFEQRPATAGPSSRSRTHSVFQPGSSETSRPQKNVAPPSSILSSLPHDPRNRPRSLTNPPLLHRLSVNILASTPPPRTKTTGFFDNTFSASPISTSPRQVPVKPPIEIPKPKLGEESPDAYLHKLLALISKAEVAGILASSGDSFYMDSLKLYMDQFSFLGDPLDVAVRKLLMDVTLPRETQQIDRVIEAFAKRYLRCNPDLFTSDDHPYILAFSLIMLHTDAFNKLNKRKMSKADYIKNTSLPGVPPEVLDCFYDNIVFAPFIFIEDALDANNHQGPMLEGATPRVFSAAGTQPPSPLPSGGTTTTLFGRAKIDPYYLITRNLLGPLRVNVEALVPAENPYSHQGTTGPLNGEELLHAFTHAIVIEMGIVDNNRLPSAFFGLNVAGMPSPMLAGVGALPEIPPSTGQVWTLKVTKVGLLNRKDEILEGGKKVSNRKWKPFSVILTKSQLLLFRDTNWAAALLSRTTNVGNRVPYPQTSIFRPDELFSIKDAVAVYDKSYTKHVNAFRLVLADGRHILFQTSDEKELNEWISRINYASTFRSTGVRMRSLGMSGKDVELTGVAAANSHLHDIQRQNHQAQPKVHSFGQRALNDSTDMSSPNNVEEPWRSMQSRRVTMMSGRQDVDLEIPVDPGIEGAYQFKATFDQVKAELAAGYWYSGEPHIVPESGSRPNSEFSVNSPASTPDGDTSRGSSRSQLIRPKVEDLETQLTTKISQLDTNMRFVRNVGIMTPFQKATRDRLQDAVQNTSKKVMQLRLDMARLICHRNVLLNDLAEEERTFHRTKTLALQAATETLQSSSAQNVLRMSFDAQDVTVGESSAAPSPDTPDQSKTESSMCNSLDSALDLGLDWSSSVEDMAALHFLNASHETDSPVTEGGCSSIGHGELNMSGRMIGRTSSDPATLVDQGGRDSQTELAEEWNKTRAAKRVSLVRLPTDFRVPTLLGKQHRPGEDGISTVVEDVASRW